LSGLGWCGALRPYEYSRPKPKTDRRFGVGDFRGRRSPASVFWRADLDPAVLTVRAAPVAAADGDAFRLDRLPCRAIVPRFGGGREQIIIGEGVRSIRIEVREGSVLSGPVRLAYDLAGFVDLDIGLRVLGQLEALHRFDRLLPTLFRGEPRAHRWAMALRAWDGRRNGASQREIAIALFGPDRVTTDWSTGDDMRKRIVRLLRTGERLIAAAGPELLRRTAP